jgi:hypothetical protein
MTLRARTVWVVLPWLLVGCAGEPKTAPVSGRVTLDGKPLANATVVFMPAAAGKRAPPSSVGVTDKDGRYSLLLSSASKKEGAVVGKHKVSITLGAATDGATEAPRTVHKQLPRKYNRNTELECDVPAAGRNDANFDLQSF